MRAQVLGYFGRTAVLFYSSSSQTKYAYPLIESYIADPGGVDELGTVGPTWGTMTRL